MLASLWTQSRISVLIELLFDLLKPVHHLRVLLLHQIELGLKLLILRNLLGVLRIYTGQI